MGENNHVQAEPVQELSEILQVRRDKLAALRELRRDLEDYADFTHGEVLWLHDRQNFRTAAAARGGT